MRCPYCGGLNRDQSAFCVNCGRDMRDVVRRTPNVPAQPAYPPQPIPSRSPVQAPTPANRRRPVASAPVPVQPVLAPEPPVPFPPHTMAQFEGLLAAGAQEYTVIESKVEDGKKIVRIAYLSCASWQQAATLFRAFKEQEEERCNIVVIQGTFPQQQDMYGFTNGQLQFDRGVRLGARVSNRYVVESGNGFASDTMRFVLNE